MPGSDTAGTARKPVSIYEIQHWIKFPDETAYVQVTEDTKADSSRDTNTYEPTYLDRKVQPKFVLGRTDTVEFEIDAMGPGGIQQKLAKYEDETDVAVEYVRTIGYDFEKGAAVAQTALVAKHAQATLNMNPFSGGANRPRRPAPRRVFDWAEDAGIVAADFSRFYGIDLADPATQLHWYRFMALFLSLLRTPDSLVAAAVSARSPLHGGSKEARAEHSRRARAWALSPTDDELRKAAEARF